VETYGGEQALSVSLQSTVQIGMAAKEIGHWYVQLPEERWEELFRDEKEVEYTEEPGVMLRGAPASADLFTKISFDAEGQWIIPAYIQRQGQEDGTS